MNEDDVPFYVEPDYELDDFDEYQFGDDYASE